ncbi:unnamed protein product [Meloidogyne enterolobii]|uniref:Uncharacterized protein n=1 Tax=Meloidogyne enterolobii TaxID=390850 RepID=A0ACB1AEN9_MELEN
MIPKLVYLNIQVFEFYGSDLTDLLIQILEGSRGLLFFFLLFWPLTSPLPFLFLH